MTTTASVRPVQLTAKSQQAQRVAGLPYDWVFMGAAAWLLGGLFLDGWAHFHQPGLETFFTPWHAVFYSGFVAIVTTLLVAPLLNRMRGIAWRDSIPAGYGASMIGAAIFGLSGIADLVWHTTLGIEQALEALFSPPHLLLATSGTLMVTGPLRAAWLRHDSGRGTWKTLGPTILVLLALLALFGFFTAYANPIVESWAARGSFGAGRSGGAAGELNLGLGVASILLHSALVVGVILLLLRRWSLPFGTLIVLLTGSALLLAVLRDTYSFIPAVFVAALITDIAMLLLRPKMDGSWQLRLFAAIVPAAYYLLYFIGLQLRGGIGWTLPVWTGAIFLAAMVGLLVSYIAVPPSLTPRNESESSI